MVDRRSDGRGSVGCGSFGRVVGSVLMVFGRVSIGGGRLAVVGWRWSVGGGRLAAVGWRWSVGGGRLAVVGWRWSVGGGRLWVSRSGPDEPWSNGNRVSGESGRQRPGPDRASTRSPSARSEKGHATRTARASVGAQPGPSRIYPEYFTIVHKDTDVVGAHRTVVEFPVTGRDGGRHVTEPNAGFRARRRGSWRRGDRTGGRSAPAARAGGTPAWS